MSFVPAAALEHRKIIYDKRTGEKLLLKLIVRGKARHFIVVCDAVTRSTGEVRWNDQIPVTVQTGREHMTDQIADEIRQASFDMYKMPVSRPKHPEP